MATDGARRTTGFVFDLDGTLVDNVYQHVLAWQQALEAEGIRLAVWRIHRKIGMSGGLLTHALLREIDQPVTEEQVDRLRRGHAEAFMRLATDMRPLPGAIELLQTLSDLQVPWIIATSGRRETAQPSLDALGLDRGMPVVTRDEVERAKPDPDLFLAGAARIGIDPLDVVVVGDSVWDLLAARRARSLGVGLLSGGYGHEELQVAGAYRIYEDPADLLRHLDEVGVRLD